MKVSPPSVAVSKISADGFGYIWKLMFIDDLGKPFGYVLQKQLSL